MADRIVFDVSNGSDGESSPEHRLRLRAADALEQGLGFVERFGDPFAVLRTLVLLEARPVAECVDALAARQHADGSMPPLGLAAQGAIGLAELAQDASVAPLLGCVEALSVLADVGALGAPCMEGIASYVGRLQLEDGSWGDPEAEGATRIFLTGMLAGQMARTPLARRELLARAGDFLAAHWSPERVSGRSWPELAAFGAWYSSVDEDLTDEALQWIGRELERGYGRGVYDAVQTVRVLLHCDAAAVPGSSLVPAALLEALLGEQGRDGGFAELAVGPDAMRVQPTIDAMLGMLRLCTVI